MAKNGGDLGRASRAGSGTFPIPLVAVCAAVPQPTKTTSSSVI